MFPEPPLHPDDDTSPSQAIRPADFDERLSQHQRDTQRQRRRGAFSLFGALIFVAGTIVVLALPAPTTRDVAPPITTAVSTASTQVVTRQTDPTIGPTVQSVTLQQNPTSVTLPPTLTTDQALGLLQSPVRINDERAAQSGAFDPFTIISNDRPRSEFVDYTAVQGDTIDEISQRYNLQPESIAWCNDRRIVTVLRPGDVLRIPPVDGACHRVLGTREESLTSLAAQYSVEDVFAIIDSPYNPTLFGRNPDDALPGGLFVFLPNGEGEPITWNPGYDVETAADGSVLTVSFAPGQTGSCGPVPPGGGSFWGNPLPNGTWVRGFYAGHTGIDIAAPTGTPIFAANGGPVIFSGFSNWGYGGAVVLAHGQFSTLYGHMSSRNVSCGQFAVTGQVIGFVGSTGISSGPHLHFEVRFNDTPTDPTTIPGVGW